MSLRPMRPDEAPAVAELLATAMADDPFAVPDRVELGRDAPTMLTMWRAART